MGSDTDRCIREETAESPTSDAYPILLLGFAIAVYYLYVMSGAPILSCFMMELVVYTLGFLGMTSYGAKYGVGLCSKLKIVFFSLLESLRWIFGGRICWIERSLTVLTPDFSGVMIEAYGYRYLLIDSESLSVVAFYESWMEEYLKVKKGDVFIDIGAHIGRYSISLSGIAKRVISVEADPENYRCLRRNVEINGIQNITAVNMLAWEKSAVVKFLLTDRKGAGTTKEGMPDRRYVSRYFELPARRMDDILESLKISRVDWIKIDVEAAEYEVLRGLEETLTEHKPQIIVEITKPNLKEVLAFMRSMEYDAEPIRESETPMLIYYRFKPRTARGRPVCNRTER